MRAKQSVSQDIQDKEEKLLLSVRCVASGNGSLAKNAGLLQSASSRLHSLGSVTFQHILFLLLLVLFDPWENEFCYLALSDPFKH